MKNLTTENLNKIIPALLMLGILIGLESFAQQRSSIGSGNWNDPSTWNCSCIPSSSDNVAVNSGHNVFLGSAGIAANNLAIMLGGSIGSGINDLTISGNLLINGSFDGMGDLVMTGGNTGLNGQGLLTTTGNLRLQGAGQATVLPTADIRTIQGGIEIDGNRSLINQGRLNVAGSIIGISNSSAVINDANAYLGIGGELLRLGNLDASASGNQVVYIGSGIQAIKEPLNSTYQILTIDKPVGIAELNSAIMVDNALNLMQGNLYLRSRRLEIGSSGQINGAGIQSYIVANSGGALILWINTIGRYDYPVGDDNFYTPFSFTLHSANLCGKSAVVLMLNKRRHQFIGAGDYISRYWSLIWRGIRNAHFDVEYTYHDQDVVGNEITLVTSMWNSFRWTQYNQTDPVNNFLSSSGPIINSRPGLIEFSAMGESMQKRSAYELQPKRGGDPYVKLIPNPLDGTKLNIIMSGFEEEEVIVALYNMMGKKIYSKIVQRSDGMVSGTDLSKKLAPGLYFVTASTSNKIYNQKLVITSRPSESSLMLK